MANIMLTDICNLHCPYCFANEFVNKDANEITLEDFEKAKEFIIGDGSTKQIGLIGGEPTLHSQFHAIIDSIARDERVQTAVLYTNGIRVCDYLDEICSPKMRLLVNCNAPDDIGENAYGRLHDSLDMLINRRYMKDRLNLGINMYHEKFEYEYILTLLEEFEISSLRVSITVPNEDKLRNINALDYFSMMKPRVLEFFEKLFAIGVVPYFDCNKMPSCALSEEEFHHMSELAEQNEKVKKNIHLSNISNSRVMCSPVIDITQDLKAVRCFGLSSCTKVDIRDFENITDLRNYYTNMVDAFSYNTVYSEKCTECYKRKTLQCNGGCLAFKVRHIMDISNYSQSLMGGRK